METQQEIWVHYLTVFLSFNSQCLQCVRKPPSQIISSTRPTLKFCRLHTLWNNYQLWKLEGGTPPVRMQGLRFPPKTTITPADGKTYVCAWNTCCTQPPTHTGGKAIFPRRASGCSWGEEKVKCSMCETSIDFKAWKSSSWLLEQSPSTSYLSSLFCFLQRLHNSSIELTVSDDKWGYLRVMALKKKSEDRQSKPWISVQTVFNFTELPFVFINLLVKIVAIN